MKAAALVTGLVASCAPAEIGPDNARAYFSENQSEFERLVERIELCKPGAGRYERTSDIHCAQPEGSSEGLRDSIGRTEAVWVRISYSGRGAEASISRIFVAMPSSFGVSFAGVVEAFVYEASPQLEEHFERRDYSAATVERLPVTDAPHHWYWQKIDR